VVRNITLTEKMFIDFLRVGICGEELNNETKENITEENLDNLYNLAQKHDLAHVVADVLFKQKLMPDYEIASAYRNCLMMSLVRYQQLTYELTRICDLLEENKIPHMLLKGSVIREYYPEPWLRTSCDIDLLVNREDLQRVGDLFVSKLNFSEPTKNSHDWSFFTENNVHIELHYDLIEQNNLTKKQARHKWNSKYLEDVWPGAVLADNKTSEYKMTDEMFYYYHIAHMAKHFENGGCGARTILDLWILNNKVEYDYSKIEKMLNESRLTKFENAVRKLSQAWFSGCDENEVTKTLGTFILTGGIYGNIENRIAIQQNKSGGRLNYAVSRIFIPYEILKFRYPVLQKHKCLLPICHICRWFHLIFKGRIGHSLNEFKLNQGLSVEKIESTTDLMERLEL